MHHTFDSGSWCSFASRHRRVHVRQQAHPSFLRNATCQAGKTRCTILRGTCAKALRRSSFGKLVALDVLFCSLSVVCVYPIAGFLVVRVPDPRVLCVFVRSHDASCDACYECLLPQMPMRRLSLLYVSISFVLDVQWCFTTLSLGKIGPFPCTTFCCHLFMSLFQGVR